MFDIARDNESAAYQKLADEYGAVIFFYKKNAPPLFNNLN
jgi:hypothetical protein